MAYTFIDPTTGNAFNGEQPYVFWYDRGQSTNLNYVKQMCILSSDATLEATMDSSVFSLLDVTQYMANETLYPREVINMKQFIDLERLKVKRFVSRGFAFNNLYVHMFYVLAFSPDAGQYKDTITINKIEYTLGADFYSEDEILQSNLSNKEISLPQSIQRAIYDVNVREEANDGITLNRKYKELLANYWDLVAKKGSMSSLIDSLAWFEYGDLVRLEEYWRREDPQGTIYINKDINTRITPEIKAQLKNIVKTTYVGLYLSLYKTYLDEDGNFVYQDSGGADIGADGTAHNPSGLTEDDTTGTGWGPATMTTTTESVPGTQTSDLEYESLTKFPGTMDPDDKILSANNLVGHYVRNFLQYILITGNNVTTYSGRVSYKNNFERIYITPVVASNIHKGTVGRYIRLDSGDFLLITDDNRNLYIGNGTDDPKAMWMPTLFDTGEQAEQYDLVGYYINVNNSTEPQYVYVDEDYADNLGVNDSYTKYAGTLVQDTTGTYSNEELLGHYIMREPGKYELLKPGFDSSFEWYRFPTYTCKVLPDEEVLSGEDLIDHYILVDDKGYTLVTDGNKGVYAGLRSYIYNPNLIYNEWVPQLKHIVAIWNNIDLCLKMTLLGNFYSTYFTPIQIDLMHSTMEHIMYTMAEKILHTSNQERQDYFDSTNTFDLTYEYE